uniref:Uncharacterized protein n=1 Tax=Cucumis sativus TaxID=3659 RepID=A0A0A0K7A2_CUCSA
MQRNTEKNTFPPAPSSTSLLPFFLLHIKPITIHSLVLNLFSDFDRLRNCIHRSELRHNRVSNLHLIQRGGGFCSSLETCG